MEPNGAAQVPLMETDYTYNLLNDLLSVTQWGGANGSAGARSRSFSYDSLSRLLTAFNPETGTVSYAYDLNGNVTNKTDARSVVTNYTYDALNRVLSKTYSNDASNSPASCYQYDVSSASCILPSPNAIGRLTNQWTQSSSAGTCLAPTGGFLTKRSVLCYDPMGRILSEQQYTPASQARATPYVLGYTYDLAGNLLSSTSGAGPGATPANPAPITFTNIFDGAGHLQTLTSSWTNNSVFPMTLFNAQTGPGPCPNPPSIPAAYAAFGGLQNAAYGNGLMLNRAYDTRLRTTCESDIGTGTTPATPGSATVTITGSEQTQ
jgi:YD repeat-containing protein